MTAPAPTDDRLRVVVDIRTGRTVYGPATQADTAMWIIRDGFWRGADLRVDVLPAVCGWTPPPGYTHHAHAGCPGAEVPAGSDAR